MKAVFLIGCPRSGTTYLQLLLSRHPAIATTNETHLFSQLLRPLFEKPAHSRPGALWTIIGEDDWYAEVRRLAENVLRRILDRKPGASVILEKTPAHTLYWRNIRRIFPEARFIYLTRDPRAVVASLLAANRSWGREFWPPDVLELARRWNTFVTSVNGLRSSPQFHELHYEDINAESLSRLFAWLGFPDAEPARYLADCHIRNLRDGELADAPWDLKADVKGFFRHGLSDGWRRELSRRQIRLIESVCLEAMLSAGYDPIGARHRQPGPARQLLSRVRTGLWWRGYRASAVIAGRKTV